MRAPSSRIQPGAPAAQLPFGLDLKNLHKLRNATQHENMTPGHAEVQRYATLTQEFYVQVLRTAFHLDYATLSLASLVKSDTLRSLLSEAEALHDQGKWMESVGKSAEAFTRLVEWMQWLVPRDHFRPDAHSLRNRATNQQESVTLQEIGREFEKLREDVALQRLLALGLDFKGYVRFKELSPIVHIMMAGNVRIAHRRDYGAADSRFLFDYALQAVLRLEPAGLAIAALSKKEQPVGG